MGAVITKIEHGSVAARYGFREKDEIITINGQLLRDIIDYYFITSEHRLEINYVRDGFPFTTVIHKDPEESLGLDFEKEIFDNIMTCRCNCLFCFVDQMPPGMRKSLYLKDDDYRLSFLHGNYITLTSLSENDMRRITKMRLSPLYVSVHATDPEVRARMMGSPSAGNILKLLNKLKTHDIQCHAQIVVVPGLNDGKVLKKTLQDLYSLYPTVKTVAVVPVGLTRYRDKSKKIRQFKKSDARKVYDQVRRFQRKSQKHYRKSVFYMSDEIYLLLGKDFPSHSHYGYFDQMGNGVGISRKLITDFNRRKRYFPREFKKKQEIWVITGVLGEKVLKPFIKHFNAIRRLKVKLIPVRNRFFGKMVTVTGLLTGEDILNEIQKRIKGSRKPDKILIPDILLRNGLFLDNLSLKELQEKIPTRVVAVPTRADGLIDGIVGTAKRKKKSRKKRSWDKSQKQSSKKVPEFKTHQDMWLDEMLKDDVEMPDLEEEVEIDSGSYRGNKIETSRGSFQKTFRRKSKKSGKKRR